MSTLRRLDLSNCPKVTNLGPILETLPRLTSLSLMGNRQHVLADFLPIAKMTELTYLVLWHCEALPEELRKVHRTPEEIDHARKVIAGLAL